VDLLVVQLKAAIRRLLDTKGVRGRVLDKVNRYGEIVIGVILERPVPPPHATLPADATPVRSKRGGPGEEKREEKGEEMREHGVAGGGRAGDDIAG
jgi:hypothetical protein